MKISRGIMAAALTALLAAGAAKAGDKPPAIIAVDGLNFGTFGCGHEVYDNMATTIYGEPVLGPQMAACALIEEAAKLTGMRNPENYLENDLRGLCGESGCGTFYRFEWDGDVKRSREVVDRLKDRILEVAAAADGAPLVIVAHSWGGVLTAEALNELYRWNAAPDLKVEKVVTLGTPLGGKLYKAAVLALINGQNFYVDQEKPGMVKEWVNYWAARDFISGPLAFADRNVQADAPADFDAAERETAARLAVIYDVGPEFQQAKADHTALWAPLSTAVWHAIYFNGGRLYLPSIGRTLDTGMNAALTSELSLR